MKQKTDKNIIANETAEYKWEKSGHFAAWLASIDGALTIYENLNRYKSFNRESIAKELRSLLKKKEAKPAIAALIYDYLQKVSIDQYGLFGKWGSKESFLYNLKETALKDYDFNKFYEAEVDHDAKQKVFQNYESEKQQLNKQIEKLNQKLAEQKKAAEAEQKKLNEAVTANDEKYLDIRAKNGLKAAENKITELNSQIYHLTEKLKGEDGKYSQLIQTNNSLSQEIDVLKNKVQELEAQPKPETFENEIKSLNGQVILKDHLLADHKQHIKQHKQTIEELQTLINEQKQQINSLTDQLSEAKAIDIKNLQKEHSAYKQFGEAMSEKVERLETAKVKLQEEVQVYKDNQSQLEKDYQDKKLQLETEIQQQRRELESDKKDFSELVKKLNSIIIPIVSFLNKLFNMKETPKSGEHNFFRVQVSSGEAEALKKFCTEDFRTVAELGSAVESTATKQDSSPKNTPNSSPRSYFWSTKKAVTKSSSYPAAVKVEENNSQQTIASPLQK